MFATPWQILIQKNVFLALSASVLNVINEMDHRNKVSCVPTLEDFLDILRKHEAENMLKYVQYTSTASFNSNEKFVPKAKNVIHWLGKKPYITIGRREYICHKGKDKNVQLKTKNAESRNKQFDHVYMKRLKRVRCTKKLNCPARFAVNKVFMMSNSEIPHITRHHKEKAACSIKNEIFKGDEMPGQEMYLFSLPSTEDHKFHTEPLDSRVRQKIEELVRKGTWNVRAIRALIKEFVASELQELDKTRRFYPTISVIRNVMNKVKSEKFSSKVDLKNVQTLVDSLDETKPVIYYRPCTVQVIGTEESGADNDPMYILDREIVLSTGAGTCGIATSDPVTEVDAEHQDYSDSYDKLKPRGSRKRCLITEFKEQICILQQNCWELEEPELISVIARLKVLNEDVANAPPKDPDVGLPIVNLSVPKVNIVPANSDNVDGTINERFTRPKLHPKKNSKRVRIVVDNVNTGIKMAKYIEQS